MLRFCVLLLRGPPDVPPISHTVYARSAITHVFHPPPPIPALTLLYPFLFAGLYGLPFTALLRIAIAVSSIGFSFALLSRSAHPMLVLFPLATCRLLGSSPAPPLFSGLHHRATTLPARYFRLGPCDCFGAVGSPFVTDTQLDLPHHYSSPFSLARRTMILRLPGAG